MAESLPSKILSERNLWWSNCDKGNNSRRTVNIRKRDQRNENEVLKFSLAARSLNLSSKYVILSLKSGNKADYFLKCLFIYFGHAVPLLPHVGFPQLQRAGATLGCGAQPSHCSGVSCAAWALGAGFRSCSTWAQSCPMAQRNLPRSGIEPCPPHWQADS